MARRWLLYAKVVIKNVLILAVAVLLVGVILTKGYERTTLYNNHKLFEENYRMVINSIYFLRQASEHRMTPEEYAEYLTKKQLRIDDFKQNLKKLFEWEKEAFKALGEEWWHMQPGYMFIVKSLLILALTEIFILTAGLYLGLRAGYNGGLLDRVVAGLAPIFSAVPSWFVAILLLFFFFWDFSFLPIDFERHLMDVQLQGGSLPLAYVVGLALPVLTLVISLIWEYAFNVRNLVKFESQSEHVLYDKARGFTDRRIMRKLLRTALPSFLTYTTYNFLEILTSVLVVEVIFDVNGLGKLLWYSFRVFKEGDTVKLVYSPTGIYFVSILMMLFYFANAVIMESLYIKLDPRVGRE